MNAASPWLRPLQVLALGLGLAIAALFVAWVQLDPPLPPTPPPTDATAASGTATPMEAALRAAASDAPAAPRPADTAPSPVPATAAATAAVLYGTVRRADGTSISEGFCWLQQDGKQVGTAGLTNGTFTFAGLQPGVHRLTSRIADELPLDRELLVQAPSTRLDLELAPRWVLRVDATTPDGAPLTEALAKKMGGLSMRSVHARAFPEALTGDLPSSASIEFEAGLGPFRANDVFGMRNQKALPKQTVGVLTMPPDRPAQVVLLLGSTVLAQQQATPGQAEVTFVLATEAVLGRTGTARFRCLDAEGKPVARARVSVGSGSGSHFSEKSVTDEQGVFVAKDLLPGRIRFGIYDGERSLPPLQFDLAAGAEVDLGDVVLQKTVALEVSFEGLGDQSSVRSFFLDVASNARWRADDSSHSAQNGMLQKLVLYPGRHALLARGQAGVALVEIDTANAPAGPLRFALQRGATLQIENRVGTGFARFRLVSARGVPVYSGELGSRRGFPIELPPGDYVAVVETAGGVQRRPFVLPAGGATLALP